jgi:membrane protein DedA with SNARE-associated domain
MTIKRILGWVALIGALSLFWKLGEIYFSFPDEETLKVSLRVLIEQYGIPFVLVGAMLESLLFVGIYFPGSIIIFLGVGLAPDALMAVYMVGAVSLGMALGYIVDYLLGRYGWYRLLQRFGLQRQLETARENLEKNEVRYIAYTFWNPGLAAFTATAAGIGQIPFWRFAPVALGAIVFWNTLWGFLVYGLGESALAIVSVKTLFIILGILFLFECGRLVVARTRR